MNAARLRYAALAAAVLLCIAAVQGGKTQRRRNIGGCLTRLQKDPNHFKRCLNETCFLFREEDPFIKIPQWMLGPDHEQYQQLFRCRNFSTAFPLPAGSRTRNRLDGISFKIHEQLSGSDHWCVWAGKDCVFNNMVDFIEVQAERTNYKFAITGLLLEISRRVSRHLQPSSAIFDTRMIVIGRRPEDDVFGTLPRLTRAFRRETWILIGVVFLVFIILAADFVITFCPRPLTFKNVFLHLTRSSNEEGALFHFNNANSNNHNNNNNQNEVSPQVNAPPNLAPQMLTTPGVATGAPSTYDSESSSENHLPASQHGRPPPPNWSADMPAGMRRRGHSSNIRGPSRDKELNAKFCRSLALSESSRWLLKIAFTFFLFIVVTFYEFAVVNYLFLQRGAKLKKEMRQFEERELAQYVVVKDTAVEDVWRVSVDPKGIYSKGKPPWQQCATVEHCLQRVINESDPSKYWITFDLQARYILRKYGVCKVLTVYETKDKMYSCGTGWLYSSNVPKNVSRRIDKNILDMRLEDKINPIVIEEGGGPEVLKCGQTQTDIDPLVIGIPLAIVVLPLLIGLIITLTLGRRRILFRCHRMSASA